jgi:enoyl-CoA hydratase
MSGNFVNSEIRNSIAFLTLNDPPAHCLSSRMTEALNDAFEGALARSDVRCIVITAAGDKIFASGADIKEVSGLDPEGNVRLLARVGEVLNKILNSPKPTIAALNGAALGGGMELALHCDFRIAVEKAKFGAPEINLGLIPGAGAIQLLPKLVGFSHARWILYSGELINAVRALEIGLVDRLVGNNEELLEQAGRMGSVLASKPPLAYHALKKALRAGMEKPFTDARDEDIKLFGMLCGSKDKLEGIKAFLEKRPPVFTGE